MSGSGREAQHEPPTVLGLLDGLIDQGVHVAGDLVIGLADIELIRVALRLLIASEDTAQRTGVPAGAVVAPSRNPAASNTGGQRRFEHTAARPAPPPRDPRCAGRTPPRALRRASHAGLSARVGAEEREQLVRGVSQLVLTVVELIRELVERQAIRRVEAGNLTPDQVERLGVALQALEERMEQIKEVFGFTDDDLDLDLGLLGRLR
ncbi:MAG TPA: gas vesicle protein GvpJ [Nitriliruptorales bacterium]|nr:gas vesicle protein GvpJ [Nitriliruptorales bacterium]